MKLQYDIELFQLNELQSDIMESPYYLPHILLSKSEKEELKKTYQGKLPSIPLSDPIIRYFAFRKQDVIKIMRSSEGSLLPSCEINGKKKPLPHTHAHTHTYTPKKNEIPKKKENERKVKSQIKKKKTEKQRKKRKHNINNGYDKI